MKKVSCICPTRGRFTTLKESISFFDKQDYENKELIIFNNHPTPIIRSENLKSNIKIINGGDYTGLSMQQIYFDLMKYIDPDSSYISIWDDDDCYFPWHLSYNISLLEKLDGQCIKHKYGYWLNINDLLNPISLAKNVLEASMVVKKEHVFFINYHNTDDINFNCPHIPWINKFTETNNFLYCDNITAMFRWNFNVNRINHHLQSVGPHKNNSDTGDGEYLNYTQLDEIYKFMCLNIKESYINGEVSEVDNLWKDSLLLKLL